VVLLFFAALAVVMLWVVFLQFLLWVMSMSFFVIVSLVLRLSSCVPSACCCSQFSGRWSVRVSVV